MFSIESGQISNGIRLYDTMDIWDGGVANNTTIHYPGYMVIHNGGVANSTMVHDGGCMDIEDGGVANNTTITDAGVQIADGGVANNTTIKTYGWMYIGDGGVANNTTIKSDGGMNISGGVANNTTIKSDGELFIYSNSVHRGIMRLCYGSLVYVYDGGTIDFTIAGRKTSDSYLINNLSAVEGDANYTITLAYNQKNGVYKLAQGASSFSSIITICNSTEVIGEISVNEMLYLDREYHLIQSNGFLNLIIKNTESLMQCTGDDIATLVFVSSKYTTKTTGKKHDGVELTYNSNAFTSISDITNDYAIIITVDSKVNGNDYADLGEVAAVVMTETKKINGITFSNKVAYTAKNTLYISEDTGSTVFLRFATVNVNDAAIGNIYGGKLSNNEEFKVAEDNNDNTTETNKATYNRNASGKFTAANAFAEEVGGYTNVHLLNTCVYTLFGGTVSELTSTKTVDSAAKYQKTVSESENFAASGSVVMIAAEAGEISGYSSVTLTDSFAENITNHTSKDSKSETATYDEAKNTVTRKVTLSHTETTAGTLKATDAVELGDVTGFATVTLKNVEQSGDFRRKDADGDDYSTVKETLNIKTNKDGSVTGTYNKTETFTRAGKFTATGSAVGAIENFSTVTLDNSDAQDITNIETAKIVTKGTALWSDMYAYDRPEDYDLNLDAMDLKVTETKSLNGSVTLKNGASADSISNFKNVSMTGSEVGKIDNVNKVTVNKGDSFISSYTGTEANDTLTIAKNAVLTASKINLGAEAKDTLAINGTLILTGSEDDLPQVEASKITGKGEIAADSATYAQLDIAFANILDVGETSNNFRGTAYENADDKLKKAIKWDGKEEYNGWLGDWDGYTAGSDMIDHIKFTVAKNSVIDLDIAGDIIWELLDKKGNALTDFNIDSLAAGEYILKLENDSDNKSKAYTITLA